MLLASSSKALHSLLCHCDHSPIADRYSYAESYQTLLQACEMEVLHGLLLD